MGRGVFIGPSENPFELEREMHELAAEFGKNPAMKALADAMAKGDLDRVTGEALRLGRALDTEHHKRLAAYTQLVTRLSNNRPVEVLEWSADRIRVRVPADAPFGETTLTAYVGRHTAGPLAFEVLDPRDQNNFQAGAVLLDPDERAYVERILAELRTVARRDNVPELEDFASKIEQLLKDAEEGKVTKEKLLEALRKAEEALAQGKEPNQEEIDKQLGELGKELQKNQLTKELGQALTDKDLEKARQELEELARKLDPKEKEKELAELQKQLDEQKSLSEQEKQELQKKLDELKQQLADKDKQLTPQQKQELQKQIEELQKKLADNDQKLTEQQKQELQKKIDQLKQEKPLTEQQKQELQKQLEQTAKQMQQQQKAQQQKSDQQKQKLEDEVRRLQKERDQAKTDQQRLDAERRLEKKKDELKQLQKNEDEKQQSAQREAIKRLQKDIEQAAQDLQKPKSKEESEQEQEARERQASQKLKDAARETGKVDSDKRKQATQRKIATQMDDLREAMQRAKQKGNKGPQDPFNRQGKNRDFAQRARGQKGSGDAWRPGPGPGPGAGAGPAAGRRPGRQGVGHRHRARPRRRSDGQVGQHQGPGPPGPGRLEGLLAARDDPRRRAEGLREPSVQGRLRQVQRHRRGRDAQREAAVQLQVLRQALLREDPPDRREPDRDRDSEGQSMTQAAVRDVESTVASFTADLRRLREEIGTMIVGQEEIVEGVLMCLARAAATRCSRACPASARRCSSARSPRRSTPRSRASSSRPT
jgi:hypothetical protein